MSRLVSVLLALASVTLIAVAMPPAFRAKVAEVKEQVAGQVPAQPPLPPVPNEPPGYVNGVWTMPPVWLQPSECMVIKRVD